MKPSSTTAVTADSTLSAATASLNLSSSTATSSNSTHSHSHDLEQPIPVKEEGTIIVEDYDANNNHHLHEEDLTQRPESVVSSTSTTTIMSSSHHSTSDKIISGGAAASASASLGGTSYRPATQCVFVDSSSVKDPYNASSMPIYQTATFKQTSSSEMGEYDYSRSGNPSRTHVEMHLAKLMKAQRALCITSGMTALDIILRLVGQGEEIVAGDDIYGGTNRLLTFLSTQNGTKVHHVDTTNLASVSKVLNVNTRVVLLETPTNPLIKIVDIPSICKMVREVCSPSALIVVDNTMMSPYLQNPLELGADLVYHSGTKYLSGHHDLMCGVVGCKSIELGEKLYFVVNSTGVGLAPFECFLLMRGIKTLSVRMDRQQSSAIKIAHYLESRGFKTRYPGLKSHPQYELHASMARGPGAVLSFETGDVNKSEKIVEAARLWLISVSFGCVNSLISMPCRMSHASIPAEVRKARQFPEDLIRLCVGIEDVDDLIEDLEIALTSAGY